MSQRSVQIDEQYEGSTFRPDQNDAKSIDEPTIWINFKNGDESAFIWIYKEYFPIMYNYGLQLDLDRDYIKDQIQELFIYIRNNRKRLTDVRSIKFYLLKSLRRRLLAHKKKKFSFLSIFGKDEQRLFEIQIIESEERKIIDQSLSGEIKTRLSKSINKLTARQKEAVLHFYYEGLSYQEIAELMELKKVKSARKLIYRAIDALRKDLRGLKSNLYK